MIVQFPLQIFNIGCDVFIRSLVCGTIQQPECWSLFYKNKKFDLTAGWSDNFIPAWGLSMTITARGGYMVQGSYLQAIGLSQFLITLLLTDIYNPTGCSFMSQGIPCIYFPVIQLFLL